MCAASVSQYLWQCWWILHTNVSIQVYTTTLTTPPFDITHNSLLLIKKEIKRKKRRRIRLLFSLSVLTFHFCCHSFCLCSIYRFSLICTFFILLCYTNRGNNMLWTHCTESNNNNHCVWVFFFLCRCCCYIIFLNGFKRKKAKNQIAKQHTNNK